MKQTILLLTYIFSFAFTHAQSGLQFSQVKFVTVTLTGSGSTGNLGTVPSGKVWKLENVQHNSSNGNNMASCSFRYNGSAVNVPIPYVISATSISSFMSNSNPIWWPAGTVIDINTTAPQTTTLYFSILEFDVVP